MEESKRNSFFFGKGFKILITVLFLLCVGVFSSAALLLAGLLQNGMRMENFNGENSISYEETYQCGTDVISYIQGQHSAVQLGIPFTTGGELDLEKTVDITDLSKKPKDQNKDTSYTVGTLRDMLAQGNIQNVANVLSDAQNGYFYDEGEMYGEESEEIAEYSQAFQYLYSGRIENEGLKTQGGKYLADYAKENPDTVSLMDLYQNLLDTAYQLENYLSADENMDEESNVMYVVENPDTNTVYTNVEAWKKGYDASVIRNMEKKLFFQGKREHGTFTDVILENNSDAEQYIRNYMKNVYFSGENETITLLIDTDYPAYDKLEYSSRFFAKYARWGKVILGFVTGSLILGVLLLLLFTVQVGRVREDRELHLRGSDKLPTEVTLAVGVVSLVCMTSLGIWYGDNGESLWDLFFFVLMIMGVLFLAASFLWSYASIVRRMKGHLVWKTSLTYTIIQSCKNVYMARKTSGRMIIGFIVLVLGNIFVVMAFSFFGLLIALIGDGVVLLYLIRENAGRQVIRDGLARIASGELDFKIDEKELIGDNKEMAEAVNHVGDGLQNAVKETLKSERLKADLITNVSHDIKTPLTSIINYVDLLKREDIQDPKIKGYIDVLDSKSQRLKQLTEDLVEASKISSGNVVLDMQPIRFGELVWQTNGEFEEKFSAKGLELVCKIPDEPMVIMADGRRMWRVVENLYNNVAKYAMPHTRVYVEVRKIGCRIIFDVKNISERPLNSIKAEELTERFVRGDVSRSTEGSGLGLSIAQNLVKLQNGTFDIYLDGDLFKVTITFEAAGE